MQLIILIISLLVFPIFLFKPLLSLYIKVNGMETKATLKLTPVRHHLTSASPRTGKAYLVDIQPAVEVSAIYKATKLRYVVKPLNDFYSLRYKNRQLVRIKYLKQNPKYFIVL